MMQLAIAVSLLLVPTVAVAAPPQRKPDPFNGRYIRAIDGDTLLVETMEGKRLTLHLHGIDAPEPGQQSGTGARDFLHELISETRDPTFKFDLWVFPTRMHGNTELTGAARVVVGHSVPGLRQAVGEELHLQIVRAGWAWHDHQAVPDDRKLIDAARQSRSAGRGLWSEASPLAPWVWRGRRHRVEPEEARGRVLESPPRRRGPHCC